MLEREILIAGITCVISLIGLVTWWLFNRREKPQQDSSDPAIATWDSEQKTEPLLDTGQENSTQDCESPAPQIIQPEVETVDTLAPLRSMLGHFEEMTLLLDSKLRIEFANKKAVRGLHLEEEGKTHGFYKVIDEVSRKQFMQGVATLAHKPHTTLKNIFLTPLGQRSLNIRLSKVVVANEVHYTAQLTSDAQEKRLNLSAEQRFSEIFHSSPDAILIIRAADEVIIDFNTGFTRLLGFDRDQAIGERTFDLNFWANLKDAEMVTSELRKNKEVTDFETTLKTLDGELKHAEISLRYIEIDNELCVMCIGRDITKRISTEAALYESEEKFEKIFHQSPDGILILRQNDGVVTDVNFETLNRGNFSKEDIVGKPITELPFLISAEELQQASIELQNSGLIGNREINVLSRDGESVPHLISAVLLELSGEPHIMVLSKDISKQRGAEERLRRSESRFRGIFENAPIGILLVDLKGRIFQANHTAANLLAYDQHHMYGIHVSRLVPDEERQFLKEALTKMSGLDHAHRSERRLVCQNGLEIWADFNVVLQHSSSGDALYYIIQIADISDLKQSQQRMEQMAFYDTLTQLANRRLFQDRLNQAIERSVRSNQSSALLYLDLDNFKRVNDTLGHQVGDHLLKEVASRLTYCVRKQDTVGRTGGDEFCVLLSEVSSPRDAGIVAQKILNHLREPIEISGQPLIVTTSIGITVVPTDGMDPNVLMRNADLAMYRAKERGRNNYQFYSEDMNVNAVKRLKTEFEIRQALENEEFELFYQPKISFSSGQVVGVESLIRWNHPTRGFLSPDEFIDIAEDTGSIIDIGSWVIQQACRACKKLNESQPHPIQVAINISPRQFRDPNLVNTMRQSLRETGLAPELVEIEITETMLMQDVEAAQVAVERFAELGVKLAIDDFGTGYSSLNYLKKFPINTVKVDRSFVMDIPDNTDDMAITSAVIAMAHELKMEVVAEGVETQEQFDFLAHHMCEYAQGWLFSKPLAYSDLVNYLELHSASAILPNRA